MNIEELSKSQLLLLTILVNFVTSIATGILTVSLLDQAPAVVTQTVNRIVDHTIETVTAPQPAAVASAPSTQDLTTAAFASLSAHTVSIYDAATGTSTDALAVGTFLPQSQIVVTTALDALPKEALIQFSDGSTAAASLAKAGQGVAVYGFGAKAVLPKLSNIGLLLAKNVQIGQTVLTLALDGTAENGIVSKIGKDSITTTLAANASGPAAVDLSGNLLGIFSGAAAGDVISASAIASLLSATSTATSSTPHA